MSIDRSQIIPPVGTAAAGCNDKTTEDASPGAAYFHTFNAAANAKPRSSDPTLNVDIVYLYSAPLVSGTAPIEPIGLAEDRRSFCQCLDESRRRVRVRFEASTIENLRTIVTKQTRVLHYSGHATPDQGLAFEDGSGGLHHHFSVPKLKALFQAGDTRNVQLCVVAACNSEYVGECFVAAGVPHVVSVQCARADDDALNGLVSDRAARIFCSAFYLALLLGKTVAHAFEIGCARVAADSNTAACQDSGKFLLLPRNSAHDEAIFSGSSASPTQATNGGGSSVALTPHALPMGAWIDVTPMLPRAVPTLGEFFFGRHVELEAAIRTVLARRLVVLRGGRGIGKSAFAAHLAAYLVDRRHFPVFVVDVHACTSVAQVCVCIDRSLGGAGLPFAQSEPLITAASVTASPSASMRFDWGGTVATSGSTASSPTPLSLLAPPPLVGHDHINASSTFVSSSSRSPTLVPATINTSSISPISLHTNSHSLPVASSAAPIILPQMLARVRAISERFRGLLLVLDGVDGVVARDGVGARSLFSALLAVGASGGRGIIGGGGGGSHVGATTIDYGSFPPSQPLMHSSSSEEDPSITAASNLSAPIGISTRNSTSSPQSDIGSSTSKGASTGVAYLRLLLTARASIGRVEAPAAVASCALSSLSPMDSLRLFTALSPRRLPLAEFSQALVELDESVSPCDAAKPQLSPVHTDIAAISRHPLFAALDGNALAISLASHLCEEFSIAQLYRALCEHDVFPIGSSMIVQSTVHHHSVQDGEVLAVIQQLKALLDDNASAHVPAFARTSAPLSVNRSTASLNKNNDIVSHRTRTSAQLTPASFTNPKVDPALLQSEPSLPNNVATAADEAVEIELVFPDDGDGIECELLAGDSRPRRMSRTGQTSIDDHELGEARRARLSEADTLCSVAQLKARLGDRAETLRCLDEALTIYAACDDACGEGDAHLQWAEFTQNAAPTSECNATSSSPLPSSLSSQQQQKRIDLAACRAHVLRALSLFRRAGDLHGEAQALIARAELAVAAVNARVASHTRDNDLISLSEALKCTSEAISPDRGLSSSPPFANISSVASVNGDVVGDAFATEKSQPVFAGAIKAPQIMSVAQAQAADLRQAETDVQAALTIYRAAKNVNGQGTALRVRGRLQLCRGNRQAARRDLETAHRIFALTRNKRGDAATLQLLGALKAQLSEYASAVTDIQDALQACRELSDERGEALCLRSLGDLHFIQGKSPQALQFLRQALPLIERHHSRRERAFALRSLGEVEVALGDVEAGLAHLEASVPLFRDMNKVYAATTTQDMFLGAQQHQHQHQLQQCDQIKLTCCTIV